MRKKLALTRRFFNGVIVAGDRADFGVVDELVMVAEAWNKVFPNDRAPDGKSALSRRFLVEGLAQGSKHSRIKYNTNCFFAIDEFPRGAVRFKVEALNCFGRIGGSLLSGETIVWKKSA